MTAPELPLRWRLEAGLAALVIPPLVHLVPLNRLAPRLGRGRPRPAGRSVDDLRAAQWVDYLLRRLPWPWRHTCLKRSAVLYHLLRREGAPVELTIGVRRTGTELAAHAWLTRGERPYLEPRRGGDHGELAADFSVIARFPEPSETT